MQKTFIPGLNAHDWNARIADSREYSIAARWTRVRLRLICDGEPVDVDVGANGLDFGGDGLGEGDRVCIQGSRSAWVDFLTWPPSPFNHSILGMDRSRKDFSIVEGRDALVRNLRVLALVFEAMREREPGVAG